MVRAFSPDGGAAPGGRSGIVRRLARGFGMQGLSFAAQALAQFLAVPVCLSAWGTAVYGDWLVLVAAGGVLVVADFGIHGHLCNGLRAAWARGEHEAGQRILQSGLGVYLILVAGLAAGLGLAVWLVDVPAALGVSRLDHAGAILVLLCLPTLLLLPRELILAVYPARGEFDRQVADALVLAMAQQGAVIVGALAGRTPLEAAAAYFGVTLVFGAGASLAALRLRHPDVRFAPRRPKAEELRTLAGKAPFYAVQQAGGVLLIQLPVIVLGRLASPAAVVAFTTMRTFTGVLRQFANQFSTVTGLEMSRLYVRGEVAAAGRLYDVAVSLTGGMVGLLGALALAVGPVFFAVWTRGAIAFDPGLAAVFIAAVLLMTPGYGAFGLLRLIDRPQPVAAALLAQTGAGLALCLILIPGRGALGAALAVTLAELLTAGPILVREAAGLLGRRVWPVLARGYVPAALCFGLAAAAAQALAGIFR